ncbi:MAG: LOG family protein [Anaerolineae bacterium]|nr:LOG family protein [Anaerolineae bacterium]
MQEFRNKVAVVTGAASGIMEAGHVGAGRDRSMGINIMLPFEQGANAIIHGDPKLVHMKYFFTRKLMFVKECDAVCLLPGGFGTMDEGFEVLTLVQTGKRDVVPLVFLDEPGGSFWRQWYDFVENTLLANNMISPDDMSLFKVTDSLEEAVAETLNFYRVYHSMRYVRERLVIRLKTRPSDELLERLREEYHDILADGTIKCSGALPAERDDPELAGLPRLVMHFSRRNYGRLRTMIDLINREGDAPAEPA